MTFSVVAVLRQSLRRLATGPALIVLAALVIVETLAAVVPGGIVRPTAGIVGAGAGGAPVVFTGNPLPIVAGLVVVVVGLYLALVTIRVFAGQWGIVERDHLTRNVGFGLLNLLGVFVVLGVVSILVVVVLVALLGIVGALVGALLVLVVAAASFFAPAFIAVEDDNVVTAFTKSFGVLARSPVRVAVLLVGLVVVNIVLQAIGGFVVGLLGPVAVLRPLVLTIFGALGSVFLWIAVARAYDHIAESA